jgi:hypothetical protein
VVAQVRPDITQISSLPAEQADKETKAAKHSQTRHHSHFDVEPITQEQKEKPT